MLFRLPAFVWLAICLCLNSAEDEIFKDVETQCKNATDYHGCIFNGLQNNTNTNNSRLVLREDYFWHPVKRKRKECRSLSEKERSDLFSAINALKNDKSKSPNVYDSYAEYHTKKTLKSVHHGPNFFGWHRIYLLRFEELLRKVNPNVTLCFWESPLNFYMSNPLDFVMFTDDFMGNGRGRVVSGPFANWTTIDGSPLKRNLGKHRDGRLLAPFEINYILSKKRHAQITHPNADFGSDLEMMHNVVHILVGGHMGDLGTSTRDPFFWFHHAYLDSVWELFCEKVRREGIDPKDDYVKVHNKLHHPKRRMDRLSPFRNEDGYSDYFTKYVYEYEEHAKCPDCLTSPYLDCNHKHHTCFALASGDTRKIDTNDSGSKGDIKIGPDHKISVLLNKTKTDGVIFLPIKIEFKDALKKSLQTESIVGCEFKKDMPGICRNTSAIISSFDVSENFKVTNYIVNDIGIPHWIYAFVAINDTGNGTSGSFISVTDKAGHQCRPFRLSDDKNKYIPWSGILNIKEDEKAVYFRTLDNINANGDFPFNPLQVESFDSRVKILFRCN